VRTGLCVHACAGGHSCAHACMLAPSHLEVERVRLSQQFSDGHFVEARAHMQEAAQARRKLVLADHAADGRHVVEAIGGGSGRGSRGGSGGRRGAREDGHEAVVLRASASVHACARGVRGLPWALAMRRSAPHGRASARLCHAVCFESARARGQAGQAVRGVRPTAKDPVTTEFIH